jgi:hypothetical protein
MKSGAAFYIFTRLSTPPTIEYFCCTKSAVNSSNYQALSDNSLSL